MYVFFFFYYYYQLTDYELAIIIKKIAKDLNPTEDIYKLI